MLLAPRATLGTDGYKASTKDNETLKRDKEASSTTKGVNSNNLPYQKKESQKHYIEHLARNREDTKPTYEDRRNTPYRGQET